MSTDDIEPICYHINVTEVVPDGSTALFEFKCKRAEEGKPQVVDTTVKVWFPREVIESWSNLAPRLLADLAAFSRQAKSNEPKSS